MKLSILLCASVILYFSVALAENAVPEPREPNCAKFLNEACTREWNPVCGDDGHTYPTECMLCFENKEKKHHVRIMSSGEMRRLLRDKDDMDNNHKSEQQRFSRK